VKNPSRATPGPHTSQEKKGRHGRDALPPGFCAGTGQRRRSRGHWIRRR